MMEPANFLRFTLAQRKVLNRVDVRPSARLDYCLSQISAVLRLSRAQSHAGVHVLGSPHLPSL